MEKLLVSDVFMEKLFKCIEKNVNRLFEDKVYDERLANLECKFQEAEGARDALKQYTRRNSIRIFGIADNPNP